MANDNRQAIEVLRQYERLSKIRRDLVRIGVIDDTATPGEMLEALRKLIPPDLLPQT